MTNTEDRVVIAFSGRARSGKNQSAIFAEEALGQKGCRVIEVSFAMALKAACEKFLGWNPETKNGEGRSLLQSVGAACREIHPSFWADFVTTFLRATTDRWSVAVLTDLRYANELEVLKQTGYRVIHINVERPGVENLLTESQRNHESENGLVGVIPDYTIVNDGDLGELTEKVLDLLRQEKLI